jgi:hypothetical protein
MENSEDIELLRLRALAKLKLKAQQPESSGPPAKEPGLMDALFPGTIQNPDEGVGGAMKWGPQEAFDIMNAPARAVAKLRGQEMSDPNAYFLRPETEQAVAKAKSDLAAHPEVDWNMPQGIGGTGMGMMPTAAMAPGLTEQGGRMLSDPLLPLSAVRSLFEMIAPSIRGMGTKIYESALKPSKALVQKKGLDPEKMLEMGYGGGFNKGLERVESDLSGMNDQVKKIVADKMIADPHATIDLTSALARTKKGLAEELMSGQHAGLQDEIAKGAQEWAGDLSSRPLGVTDPATALEYQKGVGAMGRWDKNINPQMVPAKSRIANQYYHEIGNDLQEVVPEIAPIRSEMSARIPMRQALEDAAARTAKNHAISLSDVIATTGAVAGGVGAHSPKGGIPGLLFGAVNRAAKSPQVGNALYQTGKSMEEVGPMQEAIRRALILKQLSPQEDEQ